MLVYRPFHNIGYELAALDILTLPCTYAGSARWIQSLCEQLRNFIPSSDWGISHDIRYSYWCYSIVNTFSTFRAIIINPRVTFREQLAHLFCFSNISKVVITFVLENCTQIHSCTSLEINYCIRRPWWILLGVAALFNGSDIVSEKAILNVDR